MTVHQSCEISIKRLIMIDDLYLVELADKFEGMGFTANGQPFFKVTL